MDQVNGKKLLFKENIGASFFKTTCDWRKSSSTAIGAAYLKTESISQYATQKHSGGMRRQRTSPNDRRKRRSSGASQLDVRTWDPAAPGTSYPIPHSQRVRPQSRTELRSLPYPHH